MLFCGGPLGQDFSNNLAVHVGQPEVASAVAVGELCVIQAQQVQNRGVQIVDVNLVLHGLEAEIVGSAVGHASFDAAACQPHAETVGIVIATILDFHTGAGFDRRRAS